MAEKPVRPLVSGGSPRRAKIPTHRAQHWVSDGENGRAPGIQVFMTQSAYEAINTHANSDLDNEVGGWLAGRWCRDVETKAEFVVVEALLPAQQVRSGSTFLTFTHDSQVAMLAALEERYAKKGIVGWYHTHPRMGLFLSGYDVWLHDHFFPHPWQVALVVEPHSNTGGFFIRNSKQELDSRRYFGFYELHNRRSGSVMAWSNLHVDKKEEAQKEEQKKLEAKKVEVQKGEPGKPAESAVVLKKAEVQPAKIDVKKTEPQKGEEKPTDLKKVEPSKPEVKKLELSKSEVGATDTKPLELKRATTSHVDVKKPDVRGGVLKKFEQQPRPPAKVNLQRKEETKKNGPNNEHQS